MQQSYQTQLEHMLEPLGPMYMYMHALIHDIDLGMFYVHAA